MNRNALFAGGIRPHHYCLPVLKAEAERAALLAAVTRGSPRLFLGTDSAPHARRAKEAGVRLRRHLLRARRHRAVRRGLRPPRARSSGSRASHPSTAPDFYGLPRNTGSLTLTDEPWEVPAHYPFGDDELVPLRAGERVALAPGGPHMSEPSAALPSAPAAPRSWHAASAATCRW